MEKIVYKAPNAHGSHMPDVFVLAEPGMATKYRDQKLPHHEMYFTHPPAPPNEPRIALVDVVQSFEVYQTLSGKGFEGKVARPAKADLAAIFNTEDEQAIAEQIVLHGEIQGAHH